MQSGERARPPAATFAVCWSENSTKQAPRGRKDGERWLQPLSSIKNEKGWHVRINITGSQSYEYGPFQTRENAVAFYEEALKVLDDFISLEIRSLSENVPSSEIQMQKAGPVTGMVTAEPDVKKAMQRAARTIAEYDAQCAAGVEHWRPGGEMG